MQRSSPNFPKATINSGGVSSYFIVEKQNIMCVHEMRVGVGEREGEIAGVCARACVCVKERKVRVYVDVRK